MEKTVTVPLHEFDEMRKEIEELEKGNTITITTVPNAFYPNGYCGVRMVKTFITKDEVIKEIAEANEQLTKTILELEQKASENYAKIREEHKIKNKTIFDVRNMSIWEFMSWRKK